MQSSNKRPHGLSFSEISGINIAGIKIWFLLIYWL